MSTRTSQWTECRGLQRPGRWLSTAATPRSPSTTTRCLHRFTGASSTSACPRLCGSTSRANRSGTHRNGRT
ncbi:hypothetical protein ACFPRL_36135 [Pseudoclavibacter helvolus]